MFKGKKIGVIGGSQGLGSWFVKHFRYRGLDTKFTSLDETTEFNSNIELVEAVDIVVLAVPIQAMTSTLEEIYPHLSGKFLIEICSVKKFIVDKFLELKQAYPEVDLSYYSIHPMFGPRIKNLTGHAFLFNYIYKEQIEFTQSLKEFLLEDYAVIHDIDYLEHDKLMGLVQGLNHFNLFVSARTLHDFHDNIEMIKAVSSPAYRIFLVFFTRYVLSNAELYADIQMYNEYVTEVLKTFRKEVDNLLDLIENKDRTGFVSYVDEMKPYFEDNASDISTSTQLIYQLGNILEPKK
ncbi:prephenate dehydrogenase/arogenate dehydrogenase family protein [Sediminitomix flava]|uniref:prephenate dehydrogenase/arogenate dehydrogenase family protein n=1 Tax=Sediminitomix flava TaxID=379075 RepID=UPI001304CA1E|nr:prephenate dehydrogenase/arogenate dehydrogenase family protein [Sediminitomix flava]